METQRRMVLFHLLAHKTISSWEAIGSYGITRLAVYIAMLKAEGKVITDKWESSNGKKWKRYTLELPQ